MFWPLLQQIAHVLATRKLQSGLVIFGIAWGIFSLMALLAMGRGFQEATQVDFAAFQQPMFFVSLGESSAEGAAPKELWLTEVDLTSLQNYLSIPVKISPLLMQSATTRINNQLIKINVQGVSPIFFSAQKVALATVNGRLINHLDSVSKRRVVIIPEELDRKLTATQSGTKYLTIDRVPYQVIGVLPQDNPIFSLFSKKRETVYLPAATYLSLWGENEYQIKQFLVFYPSSADHQQLERELKAYLLHRLGLGPQEEKTAFFLFDTQEIIAFYQSIIRLVYLFFSLCGVLTLAVGGFGLANLLVLLVSERAPELGLRMALGATPRHLVLHILLEACILVMLGGLIGCLLAVSLISVLQHIPLPTWVGKPTLSWPITVLSLGCMLVLALLAGFFPARRAVQLTPVQALAQSV